MAKSLTSLHNELVQKPILFSISKVSALFLWSKTWDH